MVVDITRAQVFRCLSASPKHLGEGARPHDERGSATITGVWGQSSQRCPGQGVLPLPEAGALLVFGRSMEAATLPTVL